MEKESPSKPSVAELAGRFKGHVLPMPNSNDERLIGRRPPCSLKLNSQKDDDVDKKSHKPTIPSPNPFKMKMKSSPIIEKLQANLAMSHTALLPSPKSPEVTLQTPPLSPRSPTRQQSGEEAEPVSFESPPEGVPLSSINKSRARLSFKRRPPTRQHRKSSGEETGAIGDSASSCELDSPKQNGDEEPVFHSPTEDQRAERGGSTAAGLAGHKELQDKDFTMVADDIVACTAEPTSLEGQAATVEMEAEQAQTLVSSVEEPQHSLSCPKEPRRGGSNMDDKQEEASPEEENERL